MILDDDEARREERADLIDEARAYRTQLRRHINGHKGAGKHTRAATVHERVLRASRIWLCEGPRDVHEEGGWTPEDYIARLVAHQYPGVML